MKTIRNIWIHQIDLPTNKTQAGPAIISLQSGLFIDVFKGFYWKNIKILLVKIISRKGRSRKWKEW